MKVLNFMHVMELLENLINFFEKWYMVYFVQVNLNKATFKIMNLEEAIGFIIFMNVDDTYIPLTDQWHTFSSNTVLSLQITN